MKTFIHTSASRGHVSHGWLDTYHSFSFASYHDPERIHFGMLRVLNDDTIAPGRGFGLHPHDNMEIITIPLSGALEHRDSMGNSSVIRAGDIQVMSAGTGIHHSEFNHSKEEEVSLLQIWVYPNKKDVEPRYDQVNSRQLAIENSLYQVVSPDPEDAGAWVHQDTWFHLGELSKSSEHTYSVKRENNGVFIFVVSGSIEVGGSSLEARDAMGITATQSFTIKVLEDASILLIDVPMLP